MPSIYLERNFQADCYYHLYNRGAHQQLLFHDKKDYQTFIQILSYYLLSPLGTPPSILTRHSTAKYHRTEIDKDPFFAQSPYELLAYCLMPNHFHLLIKQVSETITLSNLMRRLSVAYAMYYNSRYHHSGTIHQGKYKNIRIDNESQWLYLSKYIHRNPSKDTQRSDLCKYPYSSYPNYLQLTKDDWISTEDILSYFSQTNPHSSYQSFVEESLPGDLDLITNFTLDLA